MGFKEEKKRLEQNYEKELMDILVLLGDLGGGAVSVVKGIWEPSVNILAYIDLSTQELVKCKGCVKVSKARRIRLFCWKRWSKEM